MKTYAVIENNKVINILVGVDEDVVVANPDKYIEYTDGSWDFDNLIDGNGFFIKPNPIEILDLITD